MLKKGSARRRTSAVVGEVREVVLFSEPRGGAVDLKDRHRVERKGAYGLLDEEGPASELLALSPGHEPVLGAVAVRVGVRARVRVRVRVGVGVGVRVTLER